MPISNLKLSTIDFKQVYKERMQELQRRSSLNRLEQAELTAIQGKLSQLGSQDIKIEALFSDPKNPGEILKFVDACFTRGVINFTSPSPSNSTTNISVWLQSEKSILESQSAGLSSSKWKFWQKKKKEIQATDVKNQLDVLKNREEFLDKGVQITSTDPGIVDFGKLIDVYRTEMEGKINSYIRSSARHRGASGFGRHVRNHSGLYKVLASTAVIAAGCGLFGEKAVDVAKNTKDAITRTNPEKQRKGELMALSDTARDAIALGEVWQSVIDGGNHIHRWDELRRLSTTASLTGRQQVIRNALEQAEKEYQKYLRDTSPMRRENPEGFKRVRQERLIGYKEAWQEARSGFDALHIGKEIKKGVKKSGKIDVSKMSDAELRKLHAVEASLIPTAADYGMGIYAAEWLETGHVSPEGFTPKLPRGKTY